MPQDNPAGFPITAATIRGLIAERDREFAAAARLADQVNELAEEAARLRAENQRLKHRIHPLENEAA